MYGFVIAIMLCSGTNCDMVQAEPDVSYPSYAACHQALTTKQSALQAMADKRARPDKPARIICLHPLNTIVEVEEPHDVLDTAIVHKDPSASALYVGLVEKGKRTLVTGLVAGTDWVRVLLPDGKSGYVYADHLRRVNQRPRTASVTRPPAAAPPTQQPPMQQPPTQRLATQQPATQQPATQQPVPGATMASNQPAASSSPQPTPSAAPPARAAPPQPAPTAAAHAQATPEQQAMVLPPPPPPPPPASQPQASKPQASRGEFRDCPTCPVMVSLPGGSFEMGSGEDYSERPTHRVTLRPFALGKYEVTVAEWDTCVQAGACSYKPPAEPSPARRPVTNLSWNDAQEYVHWLAQQTGKPYRLPSESEWEYAAGAGSRSRYGWGEQAGIGKADCRGCGGSYDSHRPSDVGSYPPNAWGVHDMLGGVAEWVEDCWHLSYKGAPDDGSAWRKNYCSKHVLRGGSWMNPPGDIAVRVRNFYDTGVRYVGNGMRVALSLN